MWRSSQSVLCHWQLCLNHCAICPLCRENLPPKKANRTPKSKVKVNVLNCSGKVKILGLLRGLVSLAEVGWHFRKNEWSTTGQH
jgi:hypothetical protein